MILASGVILQAPTGRILLLQRSSAGDAAGQWAFPGGKIEEGENAEGAAARECLEETGFRVGSPGRFVCRRIKDDVDFTTYLKGVEEEFVPKLNEEHVAFAWVMPEQVMSEALVPQPASASVNVPVNGKVALDSDEDIMNSADAYSKELRERLRSSLKERAPSDTPSSNATRLHSEKIAQIRTSSEVFQRMMQESVVSGDWSKVKDFMRRNPVGAV